MAFRLRSVDRSFFEPLSRLSRKLRQASDLLAEVLDTDADRADISLRMNDLERDVAEITHSLIREVDRTFVTPIDREDLYALVRELDRVIDRMAEAADLVHLYGIESLPKSFAKQITVLQRCAELTEAAMPRLNARRDLVDYWTEIDHLEASADRQYRRIMAKLLDGRHKALEALKLRDIISAIEAAIDGFADVATMVEQIVVKES